LGHKDTSPFFFKINSSRIRRRIVRSLKTKSQKQSPCAWFEPSIHTERAIYARKDAKSSNLPYLPRIPGSWQGKKPHQ
jgi:hypothetical protein